MNAPSQSAPVNHHVQRARDPHRLLPTPVRAPRGFAFELAPAHNEFVYTPPLVADGDNVSTSQDHPPPFQAVFRPVPNTLREVAANDLGLVFTRPVEFEDSRRILEDMPKDPNLRQRHGQGFLYESGVDYEGPSGVQEEMPSSPPVFDQFVLFEEGRMETSDGHSTIRLVSEDDYADVSQRKMPGMWR